MFFFSCSFGVNPAVLIFLSFNILASWVIDAFLLCMARTDSIWSSGWKVVCFISPRNNLLTKVFLYQALGNTKISYKKISWNQNIIAIWKKNLIGFFSVKSKYNLIYYRQSSHIIFERSRTNVYDSWKSNASISKIVVFGLIKPWSVQDRTFIG